MLRVAAVDLGAGSARVAVVDLDRVPLEVEIVHRHAHGPVVAVDGSVRWDWRGLVDAVRTGLDLALERGPLASIGIDTWGVDYGVLDRRGELLSPPHSYRSDRTAGWEAVADALGREELYRRTGVQLMAINTVFQLASHDRDELAKAAHVLLLPELLLHELTGSIVAERTSAGTTGLVDVASATWADDLIEAVGGRPEWFAPIEPAGTRVGEWRGVPVHLVGGHDTASAVAALPGPPQPDAAFVATGTWLLVGAERDDVDVSDAARTENFSNEVGAVGGVRFLRNVMGLWVLERCREAWGNPSWDEILAPAEALPPGPVFDATDDRFLDPADMEAEVRAAAGLSGSAGRPEVVRCIVDSLAATAAGVVRQVGELRGRPVSEVHVIGGGTRNRPLLDALRRATGVPVRVGPVEATALGNALVQGIALGRFDGPAEARRLLTKRATWGGLPAR